VNKYKATVTYEVTLGDIEWNDKYLDHMGITGLNEQLSRAQIVERLKDGMKQEFTSEIVLAACSSSQAGDMQGTLYFGYRTKSDGSYEIVVDDSPWWIYGRGSFNTKDENWWKWHDIESESDVAIGRVVFDATDTGWGLDLQQGTTI
jgi:hypothetical protein